MFHLLTSYTYFSRIRGGRGGERWTRHFSMGGKIHRSLSCTASYSLYPSAVPRTFFPFPAPASSSGETGSNHAFGLRQHSTISSYHSGSDSTAGTKCNLLRICRIMGRG